MKGGGRAAQLSSGGFTLVELIITMFVSVLAFAIATNIFTALLTQFKQQSKIAETNIEGAVGLEVLRRDLESAGYGLPTSIMAGVTYSSEAPGLPGTLLALAGYLNDFSKADPVPRPIASVNNPTNSTLNKSDYLVVRSLSVARNSACEKSNSMRKGLPARQWGTDSPDNLLPTDRVIVIRPYISNSAQLLELRGTGATNKFSALSTDAAALAAPMDAADTYLIYGVDPSATLRFPFNRADYYIERAAGTPVHCAEKTGTLFKRVLLHGATAFGPPLPLLDCVADMEVLFGLDTVPAPDGDGVIDWTINDISTLTAEKIRLQVKEVQVHILAHEGQRDPNYTHPVSTVWVGDRNFNFVTEQIPNYQNYKWKVYKIYVRPPNFGG